MNSIGETLRRERLKRKLDLQGVSSELKISPRLLAAIEDENFDKLPGGVFTRSFIRQYARLLGLDEDEISNELQRLLEPQAPVPQPPQPPAKPTGIPLPRVEEWETAREQRFQWSKSLPALAMVLVIMLVCSAVYSWWQRSRRPVVAHDSKPAPVQTSATSPAATAPDRVQPVTPSGAGTADGKAAEGKSEGAAANQTQDAAKAPSQTAGKAAQPAPGQLATAPPASSPAAPGGTTGPAAAVKVEMTADEPVWVSARADGKYVFSGTLEANQSRTVEAGSTLVLRLGNAGGIRISLNGKPIGPVGPRGQIRTVQVTSGGFQILPPEPSKPASIDPLDPL
jgi:cytoskeleton protein RodZ